MTFDCCSFQQVHPIIIKESNEPTTTHCPCSPTSTIHLTHSLPPSIRKWKKELMEEERQFCAMPEPEGGPHGHACVTLLGDRWVFSTVLRASLSHRNAELLPWLISPHLHFQFHNSPKKPSSSENIFVEAEPFSALSVVLPGYQVRCGGSGVIGGPEGPLKSFMGK